MSDLSFLIRAPLRMEVGDGSRTTVERWSLEGIEPPAGLGGEEGEARITLPFQGFEISFDVTLRREPGRNFMRFVDLDDRQERILRHFYREIVTGRAEAVDGMIAAMDIPVEPVPMTQTRAEVKAQPPRVPRSLRALVVVGLYAMLGVLLYRPVIEPLIDRIEVGVNAKAEAGVPSPAADLGLSSRQIDHAGSIWASNAGGAAPAAAGQ
jgi:ABC-type Fe3+-siderophore transport system permease subunit